MEKYGIAHQKILLVVFDKLVESGRVSQEELYNRNPCIDTQAVVDFLGNTKSIDELE